MENHVTTNQTKREIAQTKREIARAKRLVRNKKFMHMKKCLAFLFDDDVDDDKDKHGPMMQLTAGCDVLNFRPFVDKFQTKIKPDRRYSI
jgi:hypothetical protein